MKVPSILMISQSHPWNGSQCHSLQWTSKAFCLDVIRRGVNCCGLCPLPTPILCLAGTPSGVKIKVWSNSREGFYSPVPPLTSSAPPTEMHRHPHWEGVLGTCRWWEGHLQLLGLAFLLAIPWLCDTRQVGMWGKGWKRQNFIAATLLPFGPPFLMTETRTPSASLRFTSELLRIDTFQVCKYGHQCHLT